MLGSGRECFLNVLQTCSCTLAHATSWEVDRAHWVAAAMTRFCSTVSSATWATFLAFSTNMAAALATALARFIRMSYNSSNQVARMTHTNQGQHTAGRSVLKRSYLSHTNRWKVLWCWHVHSADKGYVCLIISVVVCYCTERDVMQIRQKLQVIKLLYYLLFNRKSNSVYSFLHCKHTISHRNLSKGEQHQQSNLRETIPPAH